MYSKLMKLIFWGLAIASILMPIIVNLMFEATFNWTLSIIFPFMMLVMYPYGKWGYWLSHAPAVLSI